MGVSALLISPTLLGKIPVTVSTAMANNNEGTAQPSFALPPDMLSEAMSSDAGDKTVTSVNFATNPYESQGGLIAVEDATDDAQRRRWRRRRRLLAFGNASDTTNATKTTTAGALQNGSSVTGLSVGGVKVANLTTPIQITIPLPSTATYNPAELNETFVLNCSANGSLPGDSVRTTEDLERADFCGYTQCSPPPANNKTLINIF